MSSESVPLGLETWMGECLSTLRQIADDVAGLRAEAGISIGVPLEPTGTELLTVAEAAEILGIGPSAAYEAARRGEIPSLRLGRRVLIPERALSLLLAEGQPRDA
jgi:excisionase family DNA binding protein